LFEGGGDGGEGMGTVMVGVHAVVVVVERRGGREGGREAALTTVVVDVDHST
jgi:chloramphenicol 3-O-phosphotransferase